MAKRGAFQKAKSQQAALKLGLYGRQGSGKTFTSLLIAEGLAAQSGKRIAYVDTEHGTDFYSIAVPDRQAHPDAFDFDSLYSRSLVDTLDAVQSIDPKKHGVVVIDSVTHLWEAAIAAHKGKTTSAGTIPMHAWGRIKKPYKDLMSTLVNSDMHAIICGRQGYEYGDSPETGELVQLGYKMKAESETPYEPHILIRLEPVKQKHGPDIITAYVEKDRTGVLQGKQIQWPSYANIAAPVVGLLGGKHQAHVQTTDEVAASDHEKQHEKQAVAAEASAKMRDRLLAEVKLVENQQQLEEWNAKVRDHKEFLLSEDLTKLRDAYREVSR